MNKNKNIFKAATTLGLGLSVIAILSLGVMIPNTVASAMVGNQTPTETNINGTLPSWDNIQGSTITSSGAVITLGGESTTGASQNSSTSAINTSGVLITVTGNGGGVVQSNNSNSSVMSSSNYSSMTSSVMSSSSSTKTDGGGLSSSNYSTTSTSSSSQTSTNPSKIDSVISVIQKSLDTPIKVLDRAPGKDLGKDESLIILRERRSKTVRNVTIKYLVLSPDQMVMLNKKLPDMNQMLQEASGSSNLTISVNCNLSYPPFRIKCTIDISW